MKNAKWICLLFIGLLAFGTAAWAEGAAAAPADSAAAGGEDEEWLNSVWTQVDGLVKEKEYKLQETVTVAGVRGAEAEDQILDKLYYKGAKRYPSQDKLKKAIETLKASIAKAPEDKDVPQQKFFIAQCYEKLGQTADAKAYYDQIVKDHAKTPWAGKSQTRLQELAAAKP